MNGAQTEVVDLRHLGDTPELSKRPQWRRTGNAYFPVAAFVDGQWWVLRINAFPDHPMWTLFVGGRRRFDVDDVPAAWGDPANKNNPALDSKTAAEVLGPVESFDAYGSEVGRACDNPFCCG